MILVHAGLWEAVNFGDQGNEPEDELGETDLVVSPLTELGVMHLVASLLMYLWLFVPIIVYTPGVTPVIAELLPRTLFR